MVKKLGILFCGILFFISFQSDSFARPEYATKEKLNCTSCHYSPWGGGPRTVMGKVYGSHGMKPGKLSNIPFIYADMRFIGYLPENPTTTSNGVALMEAAVTGTAPVIEDEDGSEMRALLTYNIAPLGGAYVREAYIRWQGGTIESQSPFVFTVGRFYVPFGLLTDEHRTYTRIQTNMTFNNFSVGGAVSGDLGTDFHFDFALVNDFQTGGIFVNQDLTLGTVLNFRWNPHKIPILLGLSGNFEKTNRYPQPFGTSLYGVVSFDRLTNGKFSGSLLLERVDAKNWNNPALNTGMVNPSLDQFFIPSFDTAYLNFVLKSRSLGYYSQLKFNINNHWTLFYKFDYLALDKDYLSDGYFRHGIGFEAYLNSNLILNARYERVAGMRPEIASSNILAAQNDFFAMLRLWI